MGKRKDEFQRVAVRASGWVTLAAGALSVTAGIADQLSHNTENYLRARMPEVTQVEARRVHEIAYDANRGDEYSGGMFILMGAWVVAASSKEKWNARDKAKKEPSPPKL